MMIAHRRPALAAAVGVILFLSSSSAFAGEPCPDTAAAGSSAKDAYALGKAYESGDCHLPLDESQAEQWYLKAAKKDYVLAQYALGELYFSAGRDYPEAKAWFLKAAQNGHGRAALKLGFLNAEAHYAGLSPDPAEAEKWFLEAAKKNVEGAAFRLGNFYANTKQPRDYEKAHLWLKKAADDGDRTAMFDLATLILMNSVKNQDPRKQEEAVDWLTKAAESGVVAAQTALIQMYSTGKGAPQDTGKALKWILKLADDPQASPLWINRAADVFYSGWLDIPANYPAARRYYERAAEKGDPHARGRLGEIYTLGLGVEKDPAKAAAYFKDIPSFLPPYDKYEAGSSAAPDDRTEPAPAPQKP